MSFFASPRKFRACTGGGLGGPKKIKDWVIFPLFYKEKNYLTPLGGMLHAYPPNGGMTKCLPCAYPACHFQHSYLEITPKKMKPEKAAYMRQTACICFHMVAQWHHSPCLIGFSKAERWLHSRCTTTSGSLIVFCAF